jgi:hypothetical protein
MALRERERGRDRDDDRGGRGRDRDEPRGRDRDAPRRDRDRDEPRGRGGATRRADITYNHHKQENVKRRAEQTGGNFDLPFKSGVKTWKAKVGENAIRIMPPTWADASHYGYDVWLHSFIGSSGSTYICPKKTFNKPCAACDEAAALKAAGEDEEAKEIAVKQKVLYYIIDRDDRKPVPQILVASWNQDKEISEASKINRTNKTLYIDHADEGYDVIVKRTGQKLNTRYQWLIDRESSPLDPDSRTQDELLEFIAENPIPSLLKYDDNEKIAAALAGTTREKDKDLDDRDDRGSRAGAVTVTNRGDAAVTLRTTKPPAAAAAGVTRRMRKIRYHRAAGACAVTLTTNRGGAAVTLTRAMRKKRNVRGAAAVTVTRRTNARVAGRVTRRTNRAAAAAVTLRKRTTRPAGAGVTVTPMTGTTAGAGAETNRGPLTSGPLSLEPDRTRHGHESKT